MMTTVAAADGLHSIKSHLIIVVELTIDNFVLLGVIWD